MGHDCHLKPLPLVAYMPSDAKVLDDIRHRRCTLAKDGGADGDQTHDLVVANDALYQLSYCPVREGWFWAITPRE